MITQKDIQLCGSDDCELVAGISLVVVERLREQLKKELEEARNVKGVPLRFMEVNAIIDYVFGVEAKK